MLISKIIQRSRTIQTKDMSELVYRMLRECPTCSSDNLVTKTTKVRDKLDRVDRRFDIVQCGHCGLGFTNPLPSGDLSELYPENYLNRTETTTTEAEGVLAKLERWYRTDVYNFDVSQIEQLTGRKITSYTSALDIGCGTGERVLHLNQKGLINIQGLDLFDFWNVTLDKNKHYIQSEILDYKPESRFDLVLLYNTLEHVHDYQGILEHISNNILSADGVLIVQVPNFGSIEPKIFGKKWALLDVPKHLWQFTPSFFKSKSFDGIELTSLLTKTPPLHPVSIFPSIFRKLDISRIWIDSNTDSKMLTILKELFWMGGTVLTIPIGLVFSMFNSGMQITLSFKKKVQSGGSD